MKKLALITTHPIQYHAPMFKLLALQCNLKVFYTEGETGNRGKFDPDFNTTINWDIPLLEGYQYEFMENVSKKPGSHHFKGIGNPSMINKVEEFNPDVVLVYGWAYKSHLKVLRHFKGKVPIWFRGDSTLLDKQGTLKKILRNVFLRWVYTHVDKALYVGTQNKFYFKAFGLKESQLVFVPHAVDNERFQQDHSAEASELRNSFNIKEEDILILFAGKFEEKKDPFLLLDAFIELQVANYELQEHKLPVKSYELPERKLPVKSYELRERPLQINGEVLRDTETDRPPTTHNPQPITEGSQPITQNSQPTIHLLFVGNGALEESLKLKVESIEQKAESLKLNADNDKRPITNDLRQTNNEKQTTNIHLLFVGNCVLESSLKSQVSNLKSNHIHFLDFQNQSKMPAIYQACDLFCLPSKSETWGLAVNEAMAAGGAILVSDKVGCAVELVNEINGAIFKHGDIESLIERLELLTENKKSLQERGLKSTIKVKDCSFEKQIEAILTELSKLENE